MGTTGAGEGDPKEKLLRKAAEVVERREARERADREARIASVRSAQDTARKMELHPEPEVERMRELGRAFVRAMAGEGHAVREFFVTNDEDRLRSTTFRTSQSTGKKERGWLIRMSGRDSLVVLEDGRVGHAAWHGNSEWEDLPWSPEHERRVVEWMADHDITDTPKSYGFSVVGFAAWVADNGGAVFLQVLVMLLLTAVASRWPGDITNALGYTAISVVGIEIVIWAFANVVGPMSGNSKM